METQREKLHATPNTAAHAPQEVASAASSPKSTDNSPVMTVEEAYKMLKATPSSNWESIEQIRRQLVQQAHPGQIAGLSPEQRAQAQEQSRRANAAYALLLQERTGNSQG